MQTDQAIMSEKRDRSALLTALAHTGADVRKPKEIRCPFHDDRHASAGVYQASDGSWRFKCQAKDCGVNLDIFDVRERSGGRSVADQFREMRGSESSPKPTARKPRIFRSIDDLVCAQGAPVAMTEIYEHPDTGCPEMIVMRIERPDGKTFRQAHQREDGMIVECAPPKPWPILNRREIRTSDRVIVCEGEKTARALNEAGYVATTSPAGAGKAAHADWSMLAGKTVLLWPDNDSAGIAHMKQVAEILRGMNPPCSLLWIDAKAAGLAEKEDAADVAARGGDEALAAIIERGKPMNGAGELADFHQQIIDGKRASIPFPWHFVNAATQPLMPGEICVLCGSAGSTKTFMVYSCLRHWDRTGVKCAAYLLEDDRQYHLARMLAQAVGDSNFVNLDWIKTHESEVKDGRDRCGGEIEKIGRMVFDAPDRMLTYDQILGWLTQVCSAGVRVVVVDPVTAIDQGREPWNADKDFITRAKAILRAHGAAMLAVTHSRGGTKVQGDWLDNLAGGRAWNRFTQTVLWLERLDPPKNLKIGTIMGNEDFLINRAVRIAKSRNGNGQNWRIGFDFDPKTLGFKERGIVIGEADE